MPDRTGVPRPYFPRREKSEQDLWLDEATTLLKEKWMRPKGFVIPKVPVHFGTHIDFLLGPAAALTNMDISNPTDYVPIEVVVSAYNHERMAWEDWLGALVHELIHVAFPNEDHGSTTFAEACKVLGLEGPTTSNYATLELVEWLRAHYRPIPGRMQSVKPAIERLRDGHWYDFRPEIIADFKKRYNISEE